jgi:aminoglycoside phosphotransferase (APT) family kinase protein
MDEALQLTMPVAPHNRFDEAALAAYMAAHVAGFEGALQVAQFKGGQSNPTFLLSAGGRRYVLRKKPGGALLPSAHAVEREYRVITALQGSGVPVAQSHCLCEDSAVIGTPFYIMDHVQGRVLWDPTLPGMAPSERTAVFEDMNRVIATLHGLDVEALGLGSYGHHENHLQRQIARWSKQYQASVTGPQPAMDRLIDWLPAHIPPGESTTVVHGDLRLDNMIFHATEPRVVAVLDWELSTLGDPLVDFAYHMLTWELSAKQFRGMAGADLAGLGIPDQQTYLERYVQRTGRPSIDPERWQFYIVFNLFRLAAILQGIAKRVEKGTATSATAAETGQRAGPIAELAWRRAREHPDAS